MDFRFTLIGLLIGFLIGLTGVGGGSLMTPVMILIMGVKPLIAVATDLVYGAVTKIVGGATHMRQGTVNRRTAYLLAAGSVPATILGVGITSAIKHTHPELVNGFLLRAIAIVLILVAVLLLLKPLITAGARRWGVERSRNWRDEGADLGERWWWFLPIVGAIVGLLVGLTSVGGGSLVIAVLFFLYPRWESKEMVGTDVFHAAILGVAASIASFATGNVNMPMMLSLLLGSVPGVLLGSRLAVNIPERLLRLSLASVMLISGAKLF
jgi:uncharacterized membrane protein YfcA